MKKRIFIAAGLCIASYFGIAQQSSNSAFQNLINVNTVSPEAASIGKFGNFPVNYNTGTVAVSIPVFEINIGSIKLPISFDYNTSGVRVDEVSSSIGLGWSLSGVGIVSRNVVGLPDEAGGGYLSSPPFDSLYNDWAQSGGYGATIDNQYANFLYGSRNGTTETEPDIFSYSINGQSGKFILRKNGQFMQLPHSNNSIAQILGGYKIIDENGVVYIFDLIEHVDNPEAYAGNYASSWRLTKMIDPNTADTIFFNYESACGVNTEYYRSFSYSFGNGPDCSQTYGGNLVSHQGETYSISQMNHSDETFLKEIVWRNGKISFVNACDRKDKASEKRLNEVDVYSNLRGALTLIKIVKPYQSYFFSNVSGYTATDERNSRLRLDSVGLLPVVANTGSQTYRMMYDTTRQMPGRESYAQDQWGFNNGQFGNTTSMPKQTILYNNSYYKIGEANRTPDPEFMLACTIQSIQYPTGGKTVFAFEPHSYPTTVSYTDPQSFVAAAYGGYGSSTQSYTFTPDASVTDYMITYNFSSYNYSDVSNRPRITMTDQVTNQQTLYSSNINASLTNSNSQSPTPFHPIAGHTYLIVVNIYTTTNTNVSASLSIDWHVTYTNVPSTAIGGGLRVKSITSYDNIGNFLNRDNFTYSGSQLLTSSSYLLVNYENTVYKCGFSGSGTGGCAYYTQPTPPNSVIYHANSVYPASQFSGSPVLYGSVTKYQTDAFGQASNGQSNFQYDVFDDQAGYASTDYGKIGVLLVSNTWKNGFLKSQSDYKYNAQTSQYILIHQKQNVYQSVRLDTTMQLKIKNLFNWAMSTCYQMTMPDASHDYFLAKIPIPSGAMLLQSSTDITIDDNGNQISETQNYSYDDQTHLLPTKKQMTNSKAQTITEIIKYPHDLATGSNVYQKMLNRNIISPVVQDIKQVDNTQETQANINYFDWQGNSTLLLPQTVDQQIATNPIETRIKFNSYDKYGNILQQQKANGEYHSYVWDYYSAYPIAQVINAAQVDIAYTSFEADGTGIWTIASSVRDSITAAITGTRSYALSNGNIVKTGLTSTITYMVSYWTRNAVAYTILGTITGYPIKGRSSNGWTYFEHKITGVTSVTVSGSGSIDELRLYPANAQMTTFTYIPLIGMGSQCDINNRIIYYQYDGMQRLGVIKDQNANIVKEFSYAYQVPASTVVNVSISCSNQSGSSNYSVKFVNTLTLANYPFSVPIAGGVIGSVPPGTYNIIFSSSPAVPGTIFKVGCNSLSATGTGATFNSVVVTSTTCNTTTIISP